jgi:dTMP kinase
VECAMQDLLLFCAARVLHVSDVVAPALNAGKNVFCNRYDSSTWAYQIHGEQKMALASLFSEIRGLLPKIYVPTAYVFLMLPAEIAYDRGQKAKEKEKTHYDLKPLEYHERVLEGFDSFRNVGFGSEIRYVNAYQSREEVHRNLWNTVQQILAA